MREIDFAPYRLWCPPLNRPRTIDDLVEMYLGRPWDRDYAAGADLVFPIGLIDRPYKHDQQPLLVDRLCVCDVEEGVHLIAWPLL
ncbi:MAG: hypothetical protein IH935_10950 [Acidobacteria bacterium]|nr:hypothetical protein [Acidobacteriota bacterium]